ncbi:MAG TPA: RES domain-containing protein, partial [Longimicrobium sp.]|nr:RES domain-containing protein [Longimicrobium sp.]
RKEIDARRLTPLRTVRELRLVQLDGPGLNRAGVDGAVVNGNDYALSRAVSRLLWRRADQPDGILYPARHDNHLYAAAIFDRAQAALAPGPAEPIDDELLRRLIQRYRFGLL